MNGSRGAPNGAPRSPSSPSTQPARGKIVAAAALAALSLGAAGVWLIADDESREIRALPVEQRQALYHRTMENLKTICDPAPGRSTREFCRNQAALSLKFPECDDDCRRTARRHLSLPRP